MIHIFGSGMPSEVESFKDFEYIVEVKKDEQICFGTTVKRRTSPIGKGLTSYQKRQVHELNSKTGPAYYRTEVSTSALYPLMNKICSKIGTVPLCSKVPRFKERIGFQIPSPGRYNTCQFFTKFKQNAIPFCTNSKTREKLLNSNPGPQTYNVNKKICRRTMIMDNFGVPKILHAVEMFCINKPIDACLKCEQVCEGDYWHKNYTIFLCNLCWNEELETNEIYSKKKLKEFKKLRNCSFMHQHQKSAAAIQILPMKTVRKKIQIENYLTLYM